MTDTVITVENLSKVYRLYADPVDRLKEALHPRRKKYHREFHALQDVSFSLCRGEALGVIGKNGSGKSTLLKIISGVLTASGGSCVVDGRVSALLELGAGFNLEMSGLENIYFSGALLGFSRAEMAARVDAVLEFADIGEFIHQPVKTYSSGMFVRLAFSVAIIVDPEILIIDEALSVGDVKFQQKCMARIKQFAATRTVIFVSHDTHAIVELCDRALWLDGGRVRMDGTPRFVSEKYLEYMYSADDTVKSPVDGGSAVQAAQFDPVDDSCRQFGDRRVEICGVQMRNAHGCQPIAYSGEWLELRLLLRARSAVSRPVCGFVLKDRLGRELLADNTLLMGEDMAPFNAGESRVATFRFEQWLNLYPGEYCLGVAVADGDFDQQRQCHWIHDIMVVKCVAARLPGGLLSDLNTSVHYTKVD